MYIKEQQDLFFVYILTNMNHTVLYIGFTGNIKQRLKQHRSKSNKGFSNRCNIHKLVYFETFIYPNEGIKREKQLKKWNREWKNNLINANNPDWEDWNWRIDSF
ncbi:GIY-YIG nuclease family protein [Aquimarina agarivorans]|uniref:GIY-YIG nuclease family protein n=1 Tax=Aquimarina agarivorans TaxID=980584 RepID=UPI000248E73E|nr:GIY-YIG nuclease family protein [Aquimarina agarivorans]